MSKYLWEALDRMIMQSVQSMSSKVSQTKSDLLAIAFEEIMQSRSYYEEFMQALRNMESCPGYHDMGTLMKEQILATEYKCILERPVWHRYYLHKISRYQTPPCNLLQRTDHLVIQIMNMLELSVETFELNCKIEERVCDEDWRKLERTEHNPIPAMLSTSVAVTSTFLHPSVLCIPHEAVIGLILLLQMNQMHRDDGLRFFRNFARLQGVMKDDPLKSYGSLDGAPETKQKIDWDEVLISMFRYLYLSAEKTGRSVVLAPIIPSMQMEKDGNKIQLKCDSLFEEPHGEHMIKSLGWQENIPFMN
ncbi:uncharacterized protein BJ171DRAFT_472172 [Polychytrium aggregatum]|uniref:uncharacterized protein n=1 Tax=Polychytrium aggregatum TaxID=110093 RepID=UPI0022FE72FF|nr:uncharacterized protein BJ171DRAFT_472172 [Polychytrium aggregatum]KAI9207864.1 hypothetical protein BJ171DRAFT_472172 [Polychytrium aggregatum]